MTAIGELQAKLEEVTAERDLLLANLVAEDTNGDDPITFHVGYQRATAAMEMVKHIMKSYPAGQWRQHSNNMLNKDLLLDDEWFDALIRLRDKTQRKTKMPSLTTRAMAAHMLAAAAEGFELMFGGHDLVADEIDRSHRDENPPDDGWDMRSVSVRVWELSGYECEAHGHHDDRCPGKVTEQNQFQFSVHHRYPREQAKRNKIPIERIDLPSNCILVWNGQTGLGAGGCHGRIHREQTKARSLGLLADKSATI